MVAFLTSIGAGVERGSGVTLGAAGIVGSATQGRGGDNVIVNARTGNLLISREDEFLVGRGPDASVGRTYNSLGAFEENGDHWRLDHDRRLVGLTGTVNTAGSTMRRISGDGSDITYTYSLRAGRWSYWTTDGGGAHDELEFNGVGWTWIEDGGAGLRETYEDAGGGWWRMRRQEDRAGNALTFDYAFGLLRQVNTIDGGWVRYDWTGINVTGITTGFFNSQNGLHQTRTSTTYAYDGLNRLTHVHMDLTRSDGSGGGTYTTQYHYHGTSRLIAHITQSDGSNLFIGYDSTGRVTYLSQHVGDGTFRETVIEYFANRTEIVDARGGRTRLHHDAAGQLTQIEAPLPGGGQARPANSFQYDADGNLITATSGTGAVTTHTYDSLGMALTTVDSMGRLTSRLNDAQGRMIAETVWGTRSNGPSIPLTTRYIYSPTGRLEFEISSEGRVVRYGYDAAGLVIWKRAFTGAQYMPGSTIVPSHADMVAWATSAAAGQNQVALEEYVRDARGEMIEKVRYSATNASGNADLSDGLNRTIYQRDRAGRVLMEWNAPTSPSTFIYDGLGRLVARIDPGTGRTDFVFDDAQTRTLVTDASGLTITSTYNKLGELISEAKPEETSPFLTDRFVYDRFGNLRYTSNSNGFTTYHVWDGAGRKLADLIGGWRVVEYRYDAANRLVGTSRYSASPNISWPTLTDLQRDLTITDVRPFARPNDIHEWTVYDGSGRKVQTILGDGSTTRYTYDSAGRLIASFGYVNKLDISSYIANGPPASPVSPTPHANDTVARTFYDGDGRIIGQLAPDGGFSRTEYDGHGRKVAEVRFAGFTDQSLRGSGTFDQLLASIILDPARDVIQRWVYDGQGNLRFEIDGVRRVTQTRYFNGNIGYATGQPRQVINHFVPLAATVTDFSYPSLRANVSSGPNDAVTTMVYDGGGRLAYEVDAAGQVKRTVYDGAGRVIRTERFGEVTTIIGSEPDSMWLTALNAWSATRLAGAAVERVYYNARGDVWYRIDAEGYATRYFYDMEGRVSSEDRFSARLTPNDTWTGATVDAANKGSFSIRQFAFDHEDRPISVTHEDRTLEQWTYWADGTLARARVAARQEHETNTWYHRDQLGRLVQEMVALNELGTYDWIGGTSATNKFWGPTAMSSPDTAYQVGLSGQGELQIYHNGNLVWSNGVRGTTIGFTYTMDALSDGNLVIYRVSSSGEQSVLWSTGTAGATNGPTHFAIGNDGVLSLRRGTTTSPGTVIWSTPTQGLTGTGPGMWETVQLNTYDGLGQLVQSSNGQNGVTTYQYDRAGRLIREVSPVAAVTEYTYDAAGRQVRKRDARGNDTHFYYDAAGREIAVLDAEGSLTTTTYDAFGRVATVTRHANPASGTGLNGQPPAVTASSQDAVTSYLYDRLGRVIRMTDAEGGFEEYQHNAFNQQVSHRNKLGGLTTFAYDRLGRKTSEVVHIAAFGDDGVQRAANIVTTFAYDGRGNLTRKTEAVGLPEERNTWYAHDARGRVIEKRSDARLITAQGTSASTTAEPVERYAYDRRGNLIETTAADGGRTLRWYNLADQITHEISAGGTLTRNFYSPEGLLLETRVYDDRVTHPVNALALPPAGSGSFRSQRFMHDMIGRVVETRTGPVQTAVVTATGVTVQTRDLVTSMTYDAMGNTTRVVDPDGEVTLAGFDRLGRKVWQVDQEGFRTDWTYNAAGHVVSERAQAIQSHGVLQSAQDRLTTFTYDRLGRQRSLTRHNVQLFNPTTTHDMLSQSTVNYQYNALGQVTLKTEATGEWTQNLYDLMGRLTQQIKTPFSTHQANMTATPAVSYRYDGLGNMVQTLQHGWGDVDNSISRFVYGKGGLLSQAIDANGFTRTFRHDAMGRVTREEYQRVQELVSGTQTNSEAVATDYDLDGNALVKGIATLSGSTWTRGAAANDTAMMRYNAHGEMVERGINNVWAEQFAYDAAGRLWRTNSEDGVWRYMLYDGRGNRTVEIESEGMNITSQTMDWVLGRWGSNANALRTTWVDGVVATLTRHNRTGLAIEVIEPQRELAMGATPVNLITSYVYNAFRDRIAEIDPRGNRTDFVYNTMGKVTQKIAPQVTITTEAGTDFNVRPTELYYYDVAGRLAASRDPNGNLTRYTYLAGSGYEGKEALITSIWHADSSVETRAYDVMGNVRQINDRGAVTNLLYDRLGRLVSYGGTDRATSFQRHDELGQVVAKWNSLQGATEAERFGYDQQGRIVMHRAAGGDVTATSYSFRSNLETPGMAATVRGGWRKVVTHANTRTTREDEDLFGRTTEAQDMGGRLSTSFYDLAGRMARRTGGADLEYIWLNTGKLRSLFTMEDASTARQTIHGYNENGLLVSQRTILGSVDLENQTATYDAMGRMTSWTSASSADGVRGLPGANSSYRYDANGNIRATIGQSSMPSQNGNGTSVVGFSHWYRYDSMNRIVTDRGTLTNGQILRGIEGTDIFYDSAGNRSYILTTIGIPNGNTVATVTRREDYTWDHAGRLLTVRSAQGTVAATVPTGPGGVLATFQYDLLGRQTRQIDFASPGGNVAAFDQAITYDAAGRAATTTSTMRQGSDVTTQTTTTSYGTTGTLNYALGQALTVTTNATRNNVTTTSTTTYAYDWWQGAVNTSIATTQTNSLNGTTTLSYMQRGGQAILVQAAIADGRSRTVSYFSNLSGEVYRRSETASGSAPPGGVVGAPIDYWLRFGGREMGKVSNDGFGINDYAQSIAQRATPTGSGPFQFGRTSAVPELAFGSRLNQVTSFNIGSNASTITARAGDTLQSIARRLWGDEGLWFKLAQANGLSGDVSFEEGQTVRIPAGIMRNTFNAASLIPLDPSEVPGEITPSTPQPLPQPAPPRRRRSGGLGAILVAAVTFAVTIATSGALAVLAPKASAVLIGAASAAAGSVAGQLVGVAIGQQRRFDFAGVARSAISGAVSGGITGEINLGNAKLNAAAEGAIGSAVSQGILVTVGLQDRFSWAAVASASVAAGAESFASTKFRDWSKTSRLFGSLSPSLQAGLSKAASGSAESIARAASQSLIDGSDFGDNVLASLPDVVGQSLAVGIMAATSGREKAIEVQPREAEPLPSQAIEAMAALVAPPSPDRTYMVASGDTVEAIARNAYGSDWRAGVAAILVTNDIRMNRAGSPLIYAGSELTLPSLANVDRLTATQVGGAVVANNTQGLTAAEAAEAKGGSGGASIRTSSRPDSAERSNPPSFKPQDARPEWGQGAIGAIAATMFELNVGVKVSVGKRDFIASLRPPAGAKLPKGGTTSVFQITAADNPNKGIRVDYGYNKTTKSVNWHWNQEGAHANFRITDHHTGIGAARLGTAVDVIRRTGPYLAIVGVAISVKDIYSSPTPDYEAARQATGWAGALAGSGVGAKGGAAVGASIGGLFGGVGAAPGVVVGGFVGGLIGGGVGWFGGMSAFERTAPQPKGYRRP